MARLAPEAIGPGHAPEQFEIDFGCKAPKGAVADLIANLEPRSRFEMLRHDAEHLPAHVVAIHRMDVQPVEKSRRWRDPLFFVIERSNPAVDRGGRQRFAEVVA